MKKLILSVLMFTFMASASADVSCFGLPGDHYLLCEAIKKENCTFAGSANYFLCRGIMNDQCGMVSQNLEDYHLCRGLVTGNCYSINYMDRILCKKFE